MNYINGMTNISKNQQNALLLAEYFFSKSSINRVENHICRDIITHAPFCRIFFISSYPTFWK